MLTTTSELTGLDPPSAQSDEWIFLASTRIALILGAADAHRFVALLRV